MPTVAHGRVSPSPSASSHARAVLGALGTLSASAITLVIVFDVVEWTDAQTTLVYAEAGAVVALITALVAHWAKDTPKEPVAIAGALTATVATTLALLSAFEFWSLTEQQISALVGVVSAAVGVLSAMVARHHTTEAPAPD